MPTDRTSSPFHTGIRMNSTQYGSFFSSGQRITLTVQVQGRNPFHEWAEIVSLDDDLLELLLSRDVLPVGAQTVPGSTVEVRTGSRGTGYRCRGVIVSTGSATHLSLRLIGEVILDELREYFRIDVYLPLRLSLPLTTDDKQIKEEWLRRRAENLTRTHTDFSFIDMADQEEGTHQASFLPPPQAANISGGGVRLTASERLDSDDLVFLEVYLPLHPPAIIDVVGQVITVSEQHETGPQAFSTALRYFYIDERDRDRIVEYITTEQLAQLRSYRSGLSSLPEQEDKVSKAKKVAITIVASSLLCLMLIWFFSWMFSYADYHPKGEIHHLFEEGLRRHLEKFR